MKIPKYDGLLNALLQAMRLLGGSASTQRAVENAHVDKQWFLGL